MKTFCKQINNITTASYGAELCITHNCLNENNDVLCKHEMVQNLFQEQVSEGISSVLGDFKSFFML
jgi:hypothetical protein